MNFYTSDIKVMATITNEIGESSTISVHFRKAKRGLFKEEMAHKIMSEFNINLEHKIVKVRIH